MSPLPSILLILLLVALYSISAVIHSLKGGSRPVGRLFAALKVEAQLFLLYSIHATLLFCYAYLLYREDSIALFALFLFSTS